METSREERSIYQFFRISVLLKGLISVIEIFAGIAIYFVTPAMVLAIASFLTNGEVVNEPVDFIARHIIDLANQYTASTAKFLSFYFLSRGLVKTGLIWALLKDKVWAYPASLVVLMLFVFYQLWQIWATHSLLVVGITIFDLIVIYFIWREWQIVKRHRAQGALA